jgi:hypothetical protein
VFIGLAKTISRPYIVNMKVIKKLPKNVRTDYLEDNLQEIIFDILDRDEEYCNSGDEGIDAYDEITSASLLSKSDMQELHRFVLMYANRIKQRALEKTGSSR